MAQEEEENVAFVLSQLSKEGDRANERANAMERREEEREEAGGRRKYFLRHDATDNNLGSNAAAFLPSSDSALAVLESDIHARSARQVGHRATGFNTDPQSRVATPGAYFPFGGGNISKGLFLFMPRVMCKFLLHFRGIWDKNCHRTDAKPMQNNCILTDLGSGHSYAQ